LNSIFGTHSISGHDEFNNGDASATRLDFFLDRDNMFFQPDLSKQMHQAAVQKGTDTYKIAAIKEHFKNRSAAHKAAKKQFYCNVPSAAVVMGITTSSQASSATAPSVTAALRTKPPLAASTARSPSALVHGTTTISNTHTYQNASPNKAGTAARHL
jgi:hypothetical protein